jgi:hypothetical protein
MGAFVEGELHLVINAIVLFLLEIFGPFGGILGPFLGQILGGSWEMVTNFRSI